MFNQEFQGPVIIRDAEITDPKFQQDKNTPNAFDICLLVETQEGISDWWRGPCSSRYGTGNYAGITQMASTIETLTKIGLPNGDISRYKELIGVQTTATVKASKPTADGKVFYNVKYLGDFTGSVEALDPGEAQRRMQAAMMATQGGGQQQNSGQQQQQQSNGQTQFNGAGQQQQNNDPTQGQQFNGAQQNQNQGQQFNGAQQNQNQGGHGFSQPGQQ